MSNKPASPAPNEVRGPTLLCRPLPEFDTANLDSVCLAFECATACPLGQAWQTTKSERFAPAKARAGWRIRTLWVYAELTDADIFTRASGLNQRLWEMGDAFEIFLRPEGQQAYVEFQVAPNNQRLQLRYSNRAALDRARETSNLDSVLLPGEAFQSRTWTEPARSRWHVLAQIPAKSLSGSETSLEGCRWRFSFSRYDYTRGCDEPVISSTSPHPQADFHRQDDWGILEFVAPTDK